MSRQRAGWSWGMIVVAAGIVGCGDAEEAAEPAPTLRLETVTLIDHNAWTLADADADPLASHRPAEVRCTQDAGIKFEDGALEINTDLCNYAALTQPAQTWIQKGEVVSLVAWNQGLFAEPAAEAHLAVLAGDTILWEETLPVPGPAAAYTPRFIAPISVPEGTPIHLHVHNHGANSYYLLTLTVGGAPDDTQN